MSRSMIENMRFPAENAFKSHTKFRTENGVNNGVQRRVEIAHPLKKGDKVVVEDKILENDH